MLTEEIDHKTSLTTVIKNSIIYKALLIRKLEELLLSLYATGECRRAGDKLRCSARVQTKLVNDFKIFLNHADSLYFSF